MKLILASIIVFSLVILFIFALFPADISVSRITQSNVPKDSLYRRIADLRTWPGWNRMIPGAQPPGEVSASRLGYTDLAITVTRRTPDSIITHWTGRHGKTFDGTFRLEQDGTQTTIQWAMQFHLDWYPWEKLSGMFYERRFGEAMDSSLLNLTKSRSLP